MSRSLIGRVLLLGISLGLILTVLAGPAPAADETLKLMVGAIDTTNPFAAFARLPAAQVTVEKNGAALTVALENGFFETTIPNPGTTIVTFPAVVGEPNFPGRRFQLVFDDQGNLRVHDLDDRDPGTGSFTELNPGRGADGSYHFEILKDGFWIFNQAEAQAPIMSMTKDWYTGAYEIGPGNTNWTWDHEFNGSMFRAWAFTDPTLALPELVATWIHPDGSTTIYRYPANTRAESDNFRWYTETAVDGPDNISSTTFRIRVEFLNGFIGALADGVHTIIYHLENSNGELSNIRVETVTVDHFQYD